MTMSLAGPFVHTNFWDAEFFHKSEYQMAAMAIIDILERNSKKRHHKLIVTEIF